jgi:hypothetical protein
VGEHGLFLRGFAMIVSVSASGNVHWPVFGRLTEPSQVDHFLHRTLELWHAPKTYGAMLVIAGLLLASAAHASSYTDTLSKVVAQPSTIAPAMQTRFSILTTTTITTACTTPSTYSFDLSNNGLAAVYESILISAVVSNTQVTISGSGVCDAFGIEEVSGVWLL